MSSPTIIKHQGHIYLYGPSGSGKSTVGRILAESLNLPFLDLDEEIEREAGSPISMIFDKEGETGFRNRESRALKAAAQREAGVIALGGGTLTEPGNRVLALERGTVILLQAAVGHLASRLGSDHGERPLLAGDTNTRLQAYLHQRAQHYESFPISLDTTDKTPAQVAWKLQKLLGMYHLRGMASHKYPGYDLRIHNEGLDRLGEMIAGRGLRGPVIVVTDENVGENYLSPVHGSLSKAGFNTHTVEISPGESYKTMATVSRLWDAFSSFGVERGSTILALGGGVIGDLAGFTSATYLRGISWVSVPTSLLAIVDAGVGGKTGVDLPQGKNLVGSFHPPRLVLVDPEVLTTLPPYEFTNGMAEVVKHGVISDPGLLDICRSNQSQYQAGELFHLLSHAIAVKIKIIEEDPYEGGIRAALNYGHTVGHGVELASDFRLRHGEAVSIGMVVEAKMAEDLGLAPEGLVQEIAGILQGLSLPVVIPDDLDREAIARAMRRDKKTASGLLKFALPVQIGEVRVGIEVEDWERYLDK